MEEELKKNINLIFTVCNLFLARIHLETKHHVNMIYRAKAINISPCLEVVMQLVANLLMIEVRPLKLCNKVVR